jgi:hypothetical protein
MAVILSGRYKELEIASEDPLVSIVVTLGMSKEALREEAFANPGAFEARRMAVEKAIEELNLKPVTASSTPRP